MIRHDPGLLRVDRAVEPDRSYLELDWPTWMLDASCAEVGIDLFFGDKGENYKAAKRVCDGCPVISQCLDWGLRVDRETHGERYGVFGGLTPTQRERHEAGAGTESAA